MTPRPKRRPLRAKLVHAARVLLVVVLLLAIPAPSRTAWPEKGAAPSIARLRIDDFDGGDLTIDQESDANAMWSLRDAGGKTVATVARTLPAAADVVGYRGPTEASIVIDANEQVISVSLLSSADTVEHVDAVMRDESFFRQFQGWPWGGPAGNPQVDAVSGATLTSLALAEGVLKRMGGARPSLVFGQPITLDEIRDWFPGATAVDDSSGEVRGPGGDVIGLAIRTGPHADDLIGYQGPTEVLMKVSTDGNVESIRMRRSFDNEPYVDYVRVEAGFWAIFKGKTLAELSSFSPVDEGVEGVSGATMTSLAVADTIVAAAQAVQAQPARDDRRRSAWYESMRWTRADLATIATLLVAALISRLGWFHRRFARRLWLILVVSVIGLWSGNLVSMALIAGWSAEGVAWRLAPGLSAIAAVTLLLPPLTKSNAYCNHLCPHGAIQQLIRPTSTSRRHRHLTRKATRHLTCIPGATLVLAYVSLIVIPTIDLASWEPFHAYLFRIAPWGAMVFALASLALAAVIPMGYCRLGCPTGRLLEYLRRNAVSDRISRADYVAVGLLLINVTVRLVR